MLGYRADLLTTALSFCHIHPTQVPVQWAFLICSWNVLTCTTDKTISGSAVVLLVAQHIHSATIALSGRSFCLHKLPFPSGYLPYHKSTQSHSLTVLPLGALESFQQAGGTLRVGAKLVQGGMLGGLDFVDSDMTVLTTRRALPGSCFTRLTRLSNTASSSEPRRGDIPNQGATWHY